MSKENEVKNGLAERKGYYYPMDEGRELITPEVLNAMKELNEAANPGYEYGQQTITQSLSEETKEKLKEMLGGKDIIFEKG